MPVAAVKRRANSEAIGAAPLFTHRRRFLGKLSSLCALAERVEHGGHHGHHGDCFRNQQLQQLRQVESRHQHQGRAQDERRIQHHVQTIDVVERKQAQDHIARRKFRSVGSDELINVGKEIEM
jgi:hypothetical protein